MGSKKMALARLLSSSRAVIRSNFSSGTSLNFAAVAQPRALNGVTLDVIFGRPNGTSYGEMGISTSAVAENRRKYMQMMKSGALQPSAESILRYRMPERAPSSRKYSGVIAEAYKGKLEPLSFFKKADWIQRKNRLLGYAKAIYTIAKCHSKIPDFGIPSFRKKAKEMYKDVSIYLADGNISKLKELVSPTEASRMKTELRHREAGGWHRVKWELKDLKRVNIIHARIFAPDANNLEVAFGQITCKFTSTQTFAVYDRKNRLVAGDPKKVLNVVDHWVFEHPLFPVEGRQWSLAARLHIENPE